jgi:hypothetical protein
MSPLGLTSLFRSKAAFEVIQQRMRKNGWADHPWLKLSFEQWRHSLMLDDVAPPVRKK